VKDYAIFVATTDNYVKYTNALLNSIGKQGLHEKCNLTVYLMYHDIGDLSGYPEAAKSAMPYNVVPVHIGREDVEHPEGTKRIEFIKRARYACVSRQSEEHDVVCLMDADMFFVSPNVINLFDMVCGTNLMIGCNERFKWDIGDNYTYCGKPIFEQPQKMFRMHCNVPAILDKRKWAEVFDYYGKIAFDGRQIKGDRECGIGDLFCWNIAVYKMGRENDVVVFPMSTMTQVHHTVARIWTYIIRERGQWRTFAGDEVYSIHGRIAQDNFVSGNLDIFDRESTPEQSKHRAKVEAGLQAIQDEWNDLNYNRFLSLENFGG